MKFWIISILSCILIFSSYQSLYAQQYQDVIYLKNGGLIRGIIIEQIPYVSIKIQTKDGNIFVYKLDEIERITKEIAKDTTTIERSAMLARKKKNPITASGLSCLGGLTIGLSGLGQIYNEDYGKGVMFSVLSLGGVVLVIRGTDVIEYNPDDGAALILSGLVLYFGSEIWAIMDAYWSAQIYSSSVTVWTLDKIRIKKTT